MADLPAGGEPGRAIREEGAPAEASDDAADVQGDGAERAAEDDSATARVQAFLLFGWRMFAVKTPACASRPMC